jgi:hypothetical protein
MRLQKWVALILIITLKKYGSLYHKTKLTAMKKLIIPVFFLCVAAFFTGCDKNKTLLDENTKWEYTDSANAANVKIIQIFTANAPTLSTAPSTTTGPQVFIYANGAKLTGNSLAYGNVWPTTSVYGYLKPGSTKFDIINGRLNLNVVPNVPSFNAGDTLATITANLEKGKYYSLYLTDTAPTMRVTLREDVLESTEYQKFKMRFANFTMDVTDTFSVFSVRENAELATNITHKTISNWIQLPIPVISDTIQIRKKGSVAPYVSFNTFGATGQRLYTLLARGKQSVVGKGPAVQLITNR